MYLTKQQVIAQSVNNYAAFLVLLEGARGWWAQVHKRFSLQYAG